MPAKRVLTVILLIPGFILFLAIKDLSPWPFSLLVALFLSLAAWEFWKIFQKGQYRPSGVILIAGVALLTLFRAAWGIEASAGLLAMLCLASMAYHVFDHERGAKTPAIDFVITVSGLVYLGWLGPYLISTRDLPDGQWWLLLVLAAVWFADMLAYEVGRRIGKTKLAPVTSPGKTWEGLIAGILGSLVLTVLSAWVLNRFATPSITLLDGLIVALVMTVLTPLGDLGESLLKRQFGVKDSSNLLPGHGGFLDRLDTWIWAGALGFYLIVWIV
jgi:phosphatidate cytidylyltransferase